MKDLKDNRDLRIIQTWDAPERLVLPLFYVLLSCETWLGMMTSFPVMNQIQLLSCFVKLRINRALLRKGFSQFSFKMTVLNNTLHDI